MDPTGREVICLDNTHTTTMDQDYSRRTPLLLVQRPTWEGKRKSREDMPNTDLQPRSKNPHRTQKQGRGSNAATKPTLHNLTGKKTETLGIEPVTSQVANMYPPYPTYQKMGSYHTMTQKAEIKEKAGEKRIEPETSQVANNQDKVAPVSYTHLRAHET